MLIEPSQLLGGRELGAMHSMMGSGSDSTALERDGLIPAERLAA
jgi:hypothetical protein